MRTIDVLKHFKGNRAAVGRAVGLTRAAVHKWKKDGRVPMIHAARLDEFTRGALRFDVRDYTSESGSVQEPADQQTESVS